MTEPAAGIFSFSSNAPITQASIDVVKNSKINKLTVASPQNEHNGTRLIYSLLNHPPTNNDRFALLNNGYYFTRTTRSDEKIRFTEADMMSILRCSIFMLLFNLSPKNSVYELLVHPETLELTPILQDFEFNDSVSLCEFCDKLDRLVGVGFSLIVRRPLSRVWWLWLTKYRYAECLAVHTPSPKDYLILYKFINTTSVHLSASAELILFNERDGRVYLQNAIKRL